MNCELIEISGRPGYQVCKRCGRGRAYPREQDRPLPMPDNYSRTCGASVVESVSIKPAVGAGDKIRSWLSATEQWIAAGRPERDAAEQHLIADVCRGCEHYGKDPLLPIVMGGGTCKACGCGLQPERSLFNALRYATWRCKLGRWNPLIAAGLVGWIKFTPADQSPP